MLFNKEKLIQIFMCIPIFCIVHVNTIELHAMIHDISEESRMALKILNERQLSKFNLQQVFVDDELEKTQQIYEDYLTRDNEKIITKYNVSVKTHSIATTTVVEIVPPKEIDTGKVMVYVHGGAFVFLSARSSLSTSLPIANDLNMRVVAVDYELAPRKKYCNIVKQIEFVVRGLMENGYKPSDIALIGDSAGGTLAISVAHSLTASDIRLGCVVLLSPWVDLSFQHDGDPVEDPVLRKKDYLEVAARLVIEPGYNVDDYPFNPFTLKYTSIFPPILIQFGTIDILRNQIELFYNKLVKEGVAIEVDRYEGMWHVFQGSHPELPESYIARTAIKNFVYKHLKI